MEEILADRDVIDRLREIIRRIESHKPTESPFRASRSLRTNDMETTKNPVVAGRHPEPESLEFSDGQGIRRVTALYSTGSPDGLEPPEPSSLEGFRSLDPLLESTDGWLYLDIETTGLLGAGTMAFLVGLGQWVGSGFMVTQWLLKDRDYEPSLLQEVWRAMESSSALITFNGKCFDVPVLQNRFVLSGLTSPLPIGAHLDLLSSAKSMGKRPEYGQSLKESVRRFVGISRHKDIPGHVIPALYFMYEKEGDISLLEPVMEHNRLDVLDMACLVRVFGQVLVGARDLSGDARAFGGAGRLHYRKRNLALARKCLESARATSSDPDRNHLRLLAHVMRRQGDWESASKIWENLIQEGTEDYSDYLWLARYYELVKADLTGSIRLVEEAIQRNFDQTEPPPPLVRRKKRLERRITAQSRSGRPVI